MEHSELAGRSRAAWADYVLVALVAGVIVFWRLGAVTLDDHECKLALTVRTMVTPSLWLLPSDKVRDIPSDTPPRHWLVPVENGQPRLVKTPLSYWLAAGVAKAQRAMGDDKPVVNPVTVRLPSAVSAILCALVMLALGRRMFGQRAALLSALLFVTCIAFQKWGRNARPEMELCLLVTAAMAAFYFGIEANSRSTHWAWMAVFWVLLGLANLVKQFVPFLAAWPIVVYLFWRQSFLDRGDGTSLRWLRVFLIATAVGLAVQVSVSLVPSLQWWRRVGISNEIGSYLMIALAFGLPVLGYLVVSRPWRQILSLLPTAVPGLVLAVAIFAWWLLYIRGLFPQLADEVFAHEVTDRGAGVAGWTVGDPDRYGLALLSYSLPWLGLVPGACAVALMRRFQQHRSGLVYLLLWCVGFVAIFSSMAGKREHYILPMMPAFCLLMGFTAEDVFFKHVWIGPALTRWIGAAYGATGLIAAAIAAVKYVTSGRDVRWLHMGIVAAAVSLPMVLGGWLMWRQRFRAGLALLLASTTLVYVAYYQWGELWDRNQPVAEFAASAARMIPADAPVYHWGSPQAKIPFYFGRYVPAIQWSFPGGEEEGISAGNAAVAWLAEDPSRGPWIFGYKGDDSIFLPLGYKSVIQAVGKEDKKKEVFVLYHRSVETSPVSAPLGASGPR
jgi:4-amino-4-deoxy-L-arabinose transferase-like glycosyltransferase